MRISVTTIDAADGTRRDVLLDAEDGAPLRAVAAQLAEQHGARTEPEPCTVDGAFVDPTVPLRSSGIREGSLVGLGGSAIHDGPATRDAPTGTAEWLRYDPRPAAPVDALVELHVSSGPDAGRVWRLGAGSHDIGSAPGCAVRLAEDEFPDGAARLTITPDGSARVLIPQGDAVRLLRISAPPLSEGREELSADARAALSADPLATTSARRRRLGEEPREDPEPAAPARQWDDAVSAASGAPLALAEPTRGRRRTARSAGSADEAAPEEMDWESDEELMCGKVLLRLVPCTEPDAAVTPSERPGTLDYNRPPRIVPPLRDERYRMPTPPRPPTRRPIPMIIMVAPMVLGVVLVSIFHSYFFLMFAFFSPVMGLANWINGRRTGRKQYSQDVVTFRERRKTVQRDIRQAVREERAIRLATSLSPAEAGLIATGPGHRLWERRRRDPDHLVLRIGTVDQESLVRVEDPARDDNARKPRWIEPQTPTSVDLTDNGVIGLSGEHESVRGLARWLVAQAAVLHSPRDVQLQVLTDNAAADCWDWVRWLPHAHGSGGFEANASAPTVLLGNDPETVANRVTALTQLVRARAKASDSAMRQAVFAEPDVVVVLDGARRLRDVPGIVEVLTEGPAVRVFCVCLDGEERLLPEEAAAVIRCGPRALTLRRTNLPEMDEIRPDLVTPAWCERAARAIAPLRDVSTESTDGMPEHANLLDLLGLEPPTAQAVERRWQRRPASTALVLGAGWDGPVAFDLVRDGPHALVAGTTGSGKSELLQSFVASLAAVNRPDEMAFVLIDYKGGSAFKDCVRLPHTLGMVTDLDSHLVQRALTSLGAELRRREQMLAAVGVKDHAAYRARRQRKPGLPALPRLMLVIDEFATLAREVPEFIAGMVSIAQRGRSLGLHLVLATQRPAGVITADIRANTNLRIALRVTDKTESQDVIDSQDAVSISSATPGRALARREHGNVLPFQTGYVGRERGAESTEETDKEDHEHVVRTAEVSWQRLGRPAPLSEPPPAEEPDRDEVGTDEEPSTDLTALVEALCEAAEQGDHETQSSPWLPPLEERVLLEDLPTPPMPVSSSQSGKGTTGGDDGRLPAVSWAVEDLPQDQLQRVVTLDLNTFGHLYVVGAPRTGRSQTLRTLAGALCRTVSYADLHLYGVDAAGGALTVLGELPHCGAIVQRNDLTRMDRMLSWMNEELTRRQDMIGAQGCADLTELRGKLAPRDRPAHLLLMIDGWDALRALLLDYEGGRVLELLTRLLREGAGAGVHVFSTSDRGLLSGRAATLTDNRLMLRMTERTDFTLAGLKANDMPLVMPPGRGVRGADSVEMQVALLAAGEEGADQADALRTIGDEARRRDAEVADVRKPARFEAMPDQIEFADAYQKVTEEQRRPLWGLLGVGGDEVRPIGVDFAGRSPAFTITGPPGSGRSNTLASLGVSLLASGTGLVVLTPRDSPLRLLARHDGVRVLTGTKPTAEQLQEALDAFEGATVVLVDDADLLTYPPAGKLLEEVARTGRDSGHGLALAASGETMTQQGTGWIGEARRYRQGVLLAPQTPMEGDLIGTRLPSERLRGLPRPGHGWRRDELTGAVVEVLIPHTVLRADEG